MKCVVIFPPQWLPFNPHLAPATIQSILCNNGHEVYLRDLNMGFYDTVLTPEYIAKSLQKGFDSFNSNAKPMFDQVALNKVDLKEYPPEFQKRYTRYRKIAQVGTNPEFYQNVMANLSNSFRILRDKKDFYNLHLVEKALINITQATDILASIYYPSTVNFYRVSASSFNSFDAIKEHCLDREGNIFYEYYLSVLPEIINQNPEFIGITISDYTQIIPGLTLAMLLKANTKAHMCVGGNLFGRYTDILINAPQFFNLFTDYIVYNEGEKPLLELIKHLEGKIGIDEVPNLIYQKNNQVIINEEQPPLKINELFTPDFSNLPLKSFCTPEVIYNLQASRDCYWRKCSFCTHYFGSAYAIKKTDKVVEEIKELQEKFDARYFHFIDEAMSPAYLEKMSKRIIEGNLDIRFYIYGRLEKEFTPELLQLAYKAGLRMVMWGFESANQRVYTLMNKGELTDPEARLKIMKDAHAAGIWNYLFVMSGFPSETLEEAKETVDFLQSNHKIMSFSTGSPFVLFDKAPILNDLSKYSITRIQKIRSGFSYAHRFETSSGMTALQKKELQEYKDKTFRLSELKYRNSSYREKLFLYVCKYGIENISKMKDKIWI